MKNEFTYYPADDNEPAGVYDRHGKLVCEVTKEHGQFFAESTGQLLAAAPDLLDACRLALLLLTRQPETRCPMPDEPGFKEHIAADCEQFAREWDAAEKNLKAAIAKAEGGEQ